MLRLVIVSIMTAITVASPALAVAQEGDVDQTHEYSSELAARYARRTTTIRGVVGSSQSSDPEIPSCIESREIVGSFRSRQGERRSLGSTETEADGAFALPARRRPGVYLIRAEARSLTYIPSYGRVAEVLCLSAATRVRVSGDQVRGLRLSSGTASQEAVGAQLPATGGAPFAPGFAALTLIALGAMSLLIARPHGTARAIARSRQRKRA